MITVELGNVVSKFNGLDDILKRVLFERLSYKIGGFGVPEKTEYLFNPKTCMTYTGLVPHVLNIFTQMGIKYQTIDRRTQPLAEARFRIADGFTARDYQAEIIERASSRETIQAATGAGKTFIMSALIEKFNTEPVLIVAPKISLALQLQEEVGKFLNYPVGIIGGGQFITNTGIIVATPQSVDEDVIKRIKVLLFDEAHNIPAKTIFNIASKATNAYYRIGVSATPWRDGGDDILIEAALNIRKPYLSINASKLIAKGKLVPCNINFIKINSSCDWLGNYADTYDKAIVNNKQRNQIIVDAAKDRFDNHSTLILISKINHGKLLLNKLKKELPYEEKFYFDEDNNFVMVGNVEFLSGKDDPIRRKLVFKAVKEGFCKVLIGSTIADEGLDLPILDTLILAGAGKVSTRAFQRIGRVLRLYEGKNEALVIDFMDSNSTFYNQAMIRKALYETEPLWKIHVLEDYKVA